ncbi:MAG: 1-(5-phosphoribosyl)-5-[(5-phosphoribosylamino)methylideneamino] imidazole-4-carboxamide isomerase [Bacteroidia bacterium]|nr:1-(5-phosphoribosyl)-5-[(5-phosphoribosylamino)methylideneamino] imidazole-4-carboxamide isomerase [Bacteroidia bacterium]
MIIIPAIDIIDGKCVRLTQGDYSQKKIYSDNPLDVAKEFESAGITHLHLVDLDGAKSQHIVNYKVLETISKNTSLKIDFGGGIKSNDDIRIAFECGANQITGGSIAVKNKPMFIEWINTFGAEKIILGADVKNGKIAVNGWKEESQEELFTFLENYINSGIVYVICTDISKDGLLQGTATELYKQIISRFPAIKLIASGGVSSVSNLAELKNAGLYGAIVGKAFYEGKIKLSELKS